MIFLHEKELWNSEQEELAALLANKTEEEVFYKLDAYKFLPIKTYKNKYTALQRLIKIITLPLFPLFFVLMGVKWIVTGDKYLDSWLRKVGLNSERVNKYFL